MVAEPFAKRHRVVPTHPLTRMIRELKGLLAQSGAIFFIGVQALPPAVVIKALLARIDKRLELGIGDGIARD